MADFTIKTWQDRQIEDDALFKQFLLYWRNNEYQLALNTLNNAQLANKGFIAGVLNTVGASLNYLQNNYFNNVEDEMLERLNEFNIAISHFIDKTVYSPTQQYVVNNFVLYGENYYLCVQDSLGNLPTNTDYWVLVGLKGEDGATGTGLNLKYTWSSATVYAKYDVVYLENALYVALQANSGRNPISEQTYWQLLMNVPIAFITIGEPIDPYEGQIWVDIL